MIAAINLYLFTFFSFVYALIIVYTLLFIKRTFNVINVYKCYKCIEQFMDNYKQLFQYTLTVGLIVSCKIASYVITASLRPIGLDLVRRMRLHSVNKRINAWCQGPIALKSLETFSCVSIFWFHSGHWGRRSFAEVSYSEWQQHCYCCFSKLGIFNRGIESEVW